MNTDLKIINPSIIAKCVIYLNSTSFLASITCEGLELTKTGYPQKGVDYNRYNMEYRAKVVGVDEV